MTTYTRCPVCPGLVSEPHDPYTEHEAHVVGAAVRRNASIAAAGKTFSEVRDDLSGKLKGSAFRDAIAAHEVAYDAAYTKAAEAYAQELADAKPAGGAA